MIDAIDKDYVVICGQRVDRPKYISPSRWMEQWEQVRDDDSLRL